MRNMKKGFTLIEVSIFLAITGLLFVGIVAGVQNSLNMQRENDTAQNFLEFLRRVYSEVTNVENPGDGKGRSEKAIYGKMVTFGEKKNLLGANADNDDESTKEVFVYTVIGDVKESGTGDALTLLDGLKINVLNSKVDDAGGTVLEYAGLVDEYAPKWGASLETTCENDVNCEPNAFTGTILIVRHPTSGNVYTYFSNNVIRVNELKGGNNSNIFQHGDKSYLKDDIDGKFKQEEIDICLNTAGEKDSNARRFDIRIAARAASASGVGLVTQEESKCKK